MAGTIDAFFDHLTSRRRDARMRRDETLKTLAALGGDNLNGLAMMGTGIKAGSQVGAGFASRDAAKFEAAQLRSSAGDARAGAQRQAMEKDADTAKLIGKQRAIAAASGTAIESPTILDIMGETAQRGKYLADAERYKGEVRARDALNKAAAVEKKGKGAVVASLLEGAGTLAAGTAKYGKSIRDGDKARESGPTLADELLEDDLVTGYRTKTMRYR